MTAAAAKLPIPGTVAYQMTSRYTITCLPEEDDDFSMWAVTVEYRMRGRWAVTQRGIFTLNADGTWDLDPGCRNDDDDWLATHRFGLEDALELAREAAPHVKVNGMTPADVMEFRAAQGGTGEWA